MFRCILACFSVNCNNTSSFKLLRWLILKHILPTFLVNVFCCPNACVNDTVVLTIQRKKHSPIRWRRTTFKGIVCSKNLNCSHIIPSQYARNCTMHYVPSLSNNNNVKFSWNYRLVCACNHNLNKNQVFHPHILYANLWYCIKHKDFQISIKITLVRDWWIISNCFLKMYVYIYGNKFTEYIFLMCIKKVMTV